MLVNQNFILKNAIIINLIFVFSWNYSNGQTLYSLNNTQFFNPSGNTNISLHENQFLPNFKSDEQKWLTGFLFKPSILGFSDLQQISGNIATNKFENSVITFGINYFGFDLFNESSASASYARIFDRLTLGVDFNFCRITVKDFNSENLFKIDVFGKLKISDNFNVGFLLNNVNRAYYSNFDKSIHQNFILSAGNQPFYLDNAGNISLAADIGTNIIISNKSYLFISSKLDLYDFISINAKVISQPLIIHTGISLKLLDWFTLGAYFQFQKEFNSDQIMTSEFYW